MIKGKKVFFFAIVLFFHRFFAIFIQKYNFKYFFSRIYSLFQKYNFAVFIIFYLFIMNTKMEKKKCSGISWVKIRVVFQLSSIYCFVCRFVFN